VKHCDPSHHEKQWIHEVAQKVNMDMEQQKGKLLRDISNPANAGTLFHFFPYFKIVFKFAQIGMTLKTKQNLERKQESLQREMDDAQVQINTQDSLIENLSFHERIGAECNRIKMEELAVLIDKEQNITHKINEARVFEDQGRF